MFERVGVGEAFSFMHSLYTRITVGTPEVRS